MCICIFYSFSGSIAGSIGCAIVVVESAPAGRGAAAFGRPAGPAKPKARGAEGPPRLSLSKKSSKSWAFSFIRGKISSRW